MVDDMDVHHVYLRTAVEQDGSRADKIEEFHKKIFDRHTHQANGYWECDYSAAEGCLQSKPGGSLFAVDIRTMFAERAVPLDSGHDWTVKIFFDDFLWVVEHVYTSFRRARTDPYKAYFSFSREATNLRSNLTMNFYALIHGLKFHTWMSGKSGLLDVVL
jgi:hypothetical protein